MDIITDMDLANPELIPLETDWVESELNTGLEAIRALDLKIKHLSTLTSQAYKARDKVSLEAIQKHPEVSTISLEGLVGTITRKNALTVELNKQHQALTDTFELGIEGYLEDIKEDYAEKIKAYGKILIKLEHTDAEIEPPVNKNVTVNHTRVYDMFHVKETFMGNKPLEVIRREDVYLERLTTMVGTAVNRIKKDIKELGKDDKLSRAADDLPKLERMFLMFNRRLAVLDGHMDYKDFKTSAPKKYMNWKQNAIIILSGVLLRGAGNVAKSFMTPAGNSAKIDNKLSDVHQFVNHVEGMRDIIDDLSKHVKELTDLFAKVTEENKSALNRRAAPVMELAEFIVKHVTDLTRGTDMLFSRLVRKKK